MPSRPVCPTGPRTGCDRTPDDQPSFRLLSRRPKGNWDRRVSRPFAHYRLLQSQRRPGRRVNLTDWCCWSQDNYLCERQRLIAEILGVALTIQSHLSEHLSFLQTSAAISRLTYPSRNVFEPSSRDFALVSVQSRYFSFIDRVGQLPRSDGASL